MKSEWKVFIKGVPNRGNEVIKALTDLGAKSSFCQTGTFSSLIYYIKHDGVIDTVNINGEFGNIIKDNYKEIKLSENWKRGDILFNETHKEFAVFESDCIFPDRAECYFVTDSRKCLTDKSICKKDFRLATESEIGLFYNYLHSINKGWDAKKKQLINWRWKPKDNENYWTVIVGIANKLKLTWFGTKVDEARYELGNCFRTSDEADDMLKKVKLLFNKIKNNYERKMGSIYSWCRRSRK